MLQNSINKIEGTKYGFTLDPDYTSEDIFLRLVMSGLVSDNRATLVMNSNTKKQLDENDEKAAGSGDGGNAKPPVFKVTINNHCEDNTFYLGKRL